MNSVAWYVAIGSDIRGAGNASRDACRQFNDKPGSAKARAVVGSNGPIVCFDDRPRDRQAQPHSRLLGRKKTVEQARQMLRVDARAAVFHNTADRFGIDLL